MNEMISIVSVINDEKVFSEGLGQCLYKQVNVKYELICVNNCGNKFKSLIDAYNDGLQYCSGNWILFVHPDIYFNGVNCLSEFIQAAIQSLKENPNICLWGVAGVEIEKPSSVVTIIEQGKNRERNQQNFFHGRKYVNVQTVDACCYLTRSEVLNNIGFSNYLTGFHLVVEDLCLKIKNIGGEIVVLPVDLWHFSKGASLDYTYYREAIKLLIHHPEVYKICTTSFCFYNTIFSIFKIFFYEIRNFVHHKIINIFLLE